MKDYAGALGDLNKADALDPNNSFILQYVSPSQVSRIPFLNLMEGHLPGRGKSLWNLTLCAFVVFEGCGEM